MATRTDIDELTPLVQNHQDNEPSLQDREPKIRSRFQHWKSFLCMCFSFTLIFTTFSSLQNLERPLHHAGGLGSITLACIYIGLFLSGIFAPALVSVISCKGSILTGFIGQAIFTAGHFYPNFYTLIPCSLFLGIYSSILWTGQGTYVTIFANDYKELTKADTIPLARFNGIFYFFFQNGQIWGNLISSEILHQLDNRTATKMLDYTCGFNHCHETSISTQSANSIGKHHLSSNNLFNILFGVYLALDVLAIIITSCFVENRPVSTEIRVQVENVSEKREVINDARKSFKQNLLIVVCYHTKKWIFCLIPFFLFNGMEQAFLFTQFTNAFPECVLGIGSIGYVMVCFGVTNAVSSLIVAMDCVQNLKSRIFLFTLAFIINVTMLITMIFWNPVLGWNGMFYVIPALWGIADSVWQTFTCVLLVDMETAELEPVFAIYRMWQALGFAIIELSSHYLCFSIKLYIVVAALGIAMLLYYLVEWDMRRSKLKKTIEMNNIAEFEIETTNEDDINE